MTDIRPIQTQMIRQPGWPEIAIAVGVYVLGISFLGYWLLLQPDDKAVFRINVAGAMNFALGFVGLLGAYLYRVRNWQAFGFRPTTLKWIAISIALGVMGFGLIFIVEAVYFHFITEANTQADFQAAANGGLAAILLLLFTSAVLGPIGEELVFRGVVQSALEKFGSWVALVGSSLMFATIHGPSVIFVDAFVMGLFFGAVFRLSGSIWPAVTLHIVYNGLNLIYYSTI
ncbi:type II CAAX endopeptidase family protein [Bradyrhizobium sp. INPA03-11B]|uniref:CPBP family intramembrane glutamic endopeptidase n=1 Tax=Bradyrhizobium sp. INPA03-11B TaxID=418598 RepID=UPI00338FE1A5